VTVTVIVLGTPGVVCGYECDVVLRWWPLFVPSPQFQSNLAAIAVAESGSHNGLYVVVVRSLFAVIFCRSNRQRSADGR